MHEISICEGIIQVLEDQAKVKAFQKVNTLWLEIGPLASVELDALRFSFEVVSRGTIAEGADLQILQPPGQAWCLSCAQTVSVNARYDTCPVCGGHQLQVTSGDELRIKELDVA